MRNHYSSLLAAAVVAALTTGCWEHSPPQANQQDDDGIAAQAGQGLHQAQDAIVDAWDAVADFSYEKRSQFIAAVRKASADMETTYAAADENAQELSADVQEEVAQARAALDRELDNAATVAQDGWEQAKEAVRGAWERLRTSYEKSG